MKVKQVTTVSDHPLPFLVICIHLPTRVDRLLSPVENALLITKLGIDVINPWHFTTLLAYLAP
jgi:hypothetical protein